MTCRELTEQLLDFVGRDLPPEVQEAIKAHLCDCQPCEDYVATYQLTIIIAGRLPVAEMPDRLMARLLDAMKQAERTETA